MAKTKYIWDEVNDVVQMEKDGESGAVKAVYTYVPEPYGRLISQRRNGQTHYYHHDGLGSTRALTDSTQTRTDTYVYAGFGSEVATSGTTENPYRWVGEVAYYWMIRNIGV